MYAACEVGVPAEIDNAALYDQWPVSTRRSGFLAVFSARRSASQDNYLPASQRDGLRHF